MFCFGCHTQNSNSAHKPQICHEGISGPPLWIRKIYPGNQTCVTSSSQWAKSPTAQTKAANKVIYISAIILSEYAPNFPSFCIVSDLSFWELISAILILCDMSHSGCGHDKENDNILTCRPDVQWKGKDNTAAKRQNVILQSIFFILI